MNSRRAVFLDRDGTITQEKSYLVDLDMLELIPGSADAVRLLNESGFMTVLITNQSGAARGLFPEEMIDQAHKRLSNMLARYGAHLDAFYYCPHHPEGRLPELSYDCGCRKPKDGMFKNAINDHSIDPFGSYAVGDSFRDLQPAKGLGARTALVKTGHGAKQLAQGVPDWAKEPDHVAENLAEAVAWIVADWKNRTR